MWRNFAPFTEMQSVPDEIDWKLTTFEGLRLHQHREFMKLSFREKIERLEQMCEAEEALQQAMRAAEAARAADPQQATDQSGTSSGQRAGTGGASHEA